MEMARQHRGRDEKYEMAADVMKTDSRPTRKWWWRLANKDLERWERWDALWWCEFAGYMPTGDAYVLTATGDVQRVQWKHPNAAEEDGAHGVDGAPSEGGWGRAATGCWCEAGAAKTSTCVEATVISSHPARGTSTVYTKQLISSWLEYNYFARAHIK